MKISSYNSFDGSTYYIDGNEYCGDKWCLGKCKLPAIFIIIDETEWFIRGIMTACGPLLQPSKIQHMEGMKVDFTKVFSLDEKDWLRKAWWW